MLEGKIKMKRFIGLCLITFFVFLLGWSDPGDSYYYYYYNPYDGRYYYLYAPDNYYNSPYQELKPQIENSPPNSYHYNYYHYNYYPYDYYNSPPNYYYSPDNYYYRPHNYYYSPYDY